MSTRYNTSTSGLGLGSVGAYSDATYKVYPQSIHPTSKTVSSSTNAQQAQEVKCNKLIEDYTKAALTQLRQISRVKCTSLAAKRAYAITVVEDTETIVRTITTLDRASEGPDTIWELRKELNEFFT